MTDYTTLEHDAHVLLGYTVPDCPVCRQKRGNPRKPIAFLRNDKSELQAREYQDRLSRPN